MSTHIHLLKKLQITAMLFTISVHIHAQPSDLPFRDPSLTTEQRVKDLLNRLTTEEKISLLGYRSKSVDRLNIPAYNWWNEGLHGVARAGKATVFPQAIAMASSFNSELMYKVADAISTEARAKNNLSVAQGRRLQYMGLTFWSPNINIFRDPRWGRGQETYGEDPFLTATMGTAFVNGLQGSNKNYLKASATAKHFAVHSGPEDGRHSFNAIVDEKDLRETYLYAFKKLTEAGVESVMCAYNRINGEPCCTGKTLLQKILRDEWGFRGHVVTDCWALEDIWKQHKVLPNSVAVAAAAVKAGVNLDCSNMLQDDVMKAIQQGLLTPAEVDSALSVLLHTQMRLGFFDPPQSGPYASYNADSISNSYHRSLAKEMAVQSMVLLKNNNNILPLKKNDISSIMVIGPNAASLDALLGNYHGVTDKAISFVEGITGALDAGTRVEYDQGCDFTDTVRFGGLWAASNAEITIAVIGLTPVYEGEEGDAFLASGGDRKNFSLPASHIAFMKALRKAHTKPIIAVVTAGSSMDISAIEKYADAIVYAWYPGEQGGAALADIIFGERSPSGRLPISFYASAKDLPPYSDYAMKNRTYRYYSGKLQYPFGFGLTYTNFNYQWQSQPKENFVEGDSIQFSVSVKNTGKMDAEEAIQVYIEYPREQRMPIKELKWFKKIHIAKDQAREISISIPLNELKKWDLTRKEWKLYKGEYKLCIAENASRNILVKPFKVK